MRLFKEENGDVLAYFAFIVVIMIGLLGLVIDIGFYYKTESHLKKAANAAVLSGAQELTNSESAVTDVVDSILNYHGVQNSLKNISMVRDKDIGYELSTELETDVPMRFLKLFGVDSLKANAKSGAALAPMSRASGAVPLGIDENIPLVYMQEYKLKVDSGDSSYGNFGILALTGPGAQLYEQDLEHGFNGEIKVGDIIQTQTGNIEGKTKTAIDYRINSSSYPEDDITSRDNPRIMLVLVYKPYSISSNQLKSVEITGFAYFYIKSPMDSKDSSITGYFIERAGNGYGDSSIQNKGAYAIRLTE